MTLTSALRTATSSLASHSQQISNLSRNISGIGDPNYVRRQSDVQTSQYGGTRVETRRIVSQSVFAASMTANADAERYSVIANGLNQIASVQDLNGFSFSTGSMLNDLQKAVDFAAATPSDSAGLNALAEQARSIATTMNMSYEAVLKLKTDADKAVSQSVASINTILEELEVANNQIVKGTIANEDVYDSMDIRDRLVNELSQELGVKVIPDENNGIIITMTNGALLFEERARDVSFQGTPSFGPTTVGGQLRVDGITVTGPGASMQLETGRIAGNLELRDNVLQGQQNQLDEIARGLVEAFAETDQSGGAKPALAGLFTWSGGPGIPASGTLEAGIAGTLSLNALVDPQSGGDVTLVRDGAINGDADYTYNPAGHASFSDRLYSLSSGIDGGMTFDLAAGLPANQSLKSYAEQSTDFLNSDRKSAISDSSYRSDLAVQFRQSLQNETGPNLDQEMSRLLEVERAYQASTRVMSTVDNMLNTLLEVVR
jgi:flagellar hook-associated protein 1 FlgK